MSCFCCNLIYINTAIPTRNAYFGEGDVDLTILLDDVTCFGNETSLENCHSNTNRTSGINCSHFEDAGVFCNGQYQLLTCNISVVTASFV